MGIRIILLWTDSHVGVVLNEIVDQVVSAPPEDRLQEKDIPRITTDRIKKA